MFKLQIVKPANKAPSFKKRLNPNFIVELVKGADGKIENESIVKYESPKASDPEGDKITMKFQLERKDYLKAKQNRDNSFTLKVNRAGLPHKSQRVIIQVILKDSSGKSKEYNMMVSVKYDESKWLSAKKELK